MPGDVGTFALDVARWVEKAGRNFDLACRDGVVDLGTRIVDRTPLQTPPEDETVARGDWNAAVGGEPGDVQRGDASGMRAIDGFKAVAANWNPSKGESMFIGNYRHYIGLLEYGGYPPGPKVKNGHSSQAPNGMVGISCLEWDTIMDKAAARHA